uniref:Uncharacterized protein n=1 Tax=Acanthochromis polyacanthus TaxID=80966 RepID=A0A3Q1EKN4_9TELE
AERALFGAGSEKDSECRSSLPRTFIRLNDLSGLGTGGGECSEVVVEPASPAPDGISTGGEEASASGGESLPYPEWAPVVFFYLKQTTRPRSWCLKMVSNPYPFIPRSLLMRTCALPPVTGKKHLLGCAASPVDLGSWKHFLTCGCECDYCWLLLCR